MKTKTKQDLYTIVDDLVTEYNSASSVDEKGKILVNVIKGVNAIKEIENQSVENLIKRKRFKLDEDKLEVERERLDFEDERMILDKEKLDFDKFKFDLLNENDIRKLSLEDSKLIFEEKKFNVDLDKAKKDKIFNGVMKGLEIGLPLIIYASLSVLSLKAIYKDDVRVPSETWNFIKGVSRK